MPAISDRMTIVTFQSLALSARRPMIMLTASMISTGAALTTPICPASSPLSLSQIEKYADPAPVAAKTVE